MRAHQPQARLGAALPCAHCDQRTALAAHVIATAGSRGRRIKPLYLFKPGITEPLEHRRHSMEERDSLPEKSEQCFDLHHVVNPE